MLLLKSVSAGKVPMSLVNINNGKVCAHALTSQGIVDIEIEGVPADIEFLEQFNEKLFLKVREQPLKTFNVRETRVTAAQLLTQEVIEVAHFSTPEAFIFLYAVEKFLTIKSGKISLWNSNGEIASE